MWPSLEQKGVPGAESSGFFPASRAGNAKGVNGNLSGGRRLSIVPPHTTKLDNVERILHQLLPLQQRFILEIVVVEWMIQRWHGGSRQELAPPPPPISRLRSPDPAGWDAGGWPARSKEAFSRLHR